MAAKTFQSASDILNWVLRKQDPSWAAATTLYWGLHSAAVPLGGDQQSNEATYAPYARVPFIRDATTGLWTAAVNGLSETKTLVQFARCTLAGGGAGGLVETLPAITIGVNAIGASTVLYTGLMSSPVNIYINVRPEIDPGDATVQET